MTDDVLKDFFGAGAALAERTKPAAGVIDFSKVISFDVSVQTLRQLSKIPPVRRDPDFRRVVIAPLPDVYGMMRMFDLEGEGIRPEIHVVRSEQQAWAILGVENPRFKALKIE